MTSAASGNPSRKNRWARFRVQIRERQWAGMKKLNRERVNNLLAGIAQFGKTKKE
jgi:stress-induced morphogen